MADSGNPRLSFDRSAIQNSSQIACSILGVAQELMEVKLPDPTGPLSKIPATGATSLHEAPPDGGINAIQTWMSAYRNTRTIRCVVTSHRYEE